MKIDNGKLAVIGVPAAGSSAPETPTEPAAPLPWSVWGAMLALIAVVFFLRYAEAVFVPIVLAVLLGYALDPVVSRMARWRLPRPVGALIVLLALLGGLGGGAYMMRQNFIAVMEEVPEIAKSLRTTFQHRFDGSTSPDTLDRIKQAASEIEKTAAATASSSPPKAGVTRVEVEPARFRVSDYLVTGTRGLAALAGQVAVILFLVYFLLASGDLYKRKIVRMIGEDFSQKRVTVEAIHEIDRQIERFLTVQIWTSVFVGFSTWLSLVYFGVAHAVVWATAAGILNFIPYFGAVIAAGGLGLVAIAQFGNFTAALEVAALQILIRTIEGGFLTPILMGKVAGINGVALFISLLFWGWLWGLIGTLVAVPIMMIIKTACERIEGLQGVSELLSEK